MIILLTASFSSEMKGNELWREKFCVSSDVIKFCHTEIFRRFHWDVFHTVFALQQSLPASGVVW